MDPLHAALAMPSAAPPPQGRCTERLQAIGEQIRARRRRLGITCVATAEAAGLYALNRRHLNLDVMAEPERLLMETLDQVFRG